MTRAEQMSFEIGEPIAPASAVNGAATVTLPAPGLGRRWLICDGAMSASAAPAAAVSATITSGSTQLYRVEFAAAAQPPVRLPRLICGQNEEVVITLPALGASVRGTTSVMARAIAAP